MKWTTKKMKLVHGHNQILTIFINIKTTLQENGQTKNGQVNPAFENDGPGQNNNVTPHTNGQLTSTVSCRKN